MTVTALPRPTTAPVAPAARWVPTRAGLLNVWRYYDEVLEFHGGRLLLRGANGSGKSKALELLLPFLLDANLRAQRLSTFGTGERTMHWNLMGQGASGVTRVGYVWVEFGTPDGEQWFTAGARLQASSHTTTVHPDYFTTSRRVGHDLHLATEAGTPCSRAELSEALGEHGTRHEHATDYRATVRQTLFAGMSEQRYDALITALLQLRTPKLSQRLDPALLSTLLSRALPPLGQDEVTDLAEGFERLDRQRERLARLEEEVTSASALATRQRTYAQRVLRAGAAGVVSTTSEMDGRTRAARLSEQRHHEALAEREAAVARTGELEALLEEATTRLDALRDSEAYREGTALEDLRRQLNDARRGAERADEAADTAGRAADADTDSATSARDHADRQEAVRATRWDESVASAREAGLSGVLTHVAVDGARGLLHAAVDSRREQIREVGRDLDAWERAVSLRTDREAELDHTRGVLTEAGAAQRAASDRYASALAHQAERLASWLRGTRVLTGGDDLDDLVDGLLAAAGSEVEVRGVVEAAAARVRRELDLAEAAHERRRGDLAADRDRARAEHDRIAAEREVSPLAPPTRTAERAGRPGAPLWRLLTFADTVPADRHAAIEAALGASGLLDAWVSPTGASLRVEGHDLFVRALRPAPGPSLLDVVVPDTDAAATVDPAHLRALLAGIATGDDLDAHPAVVAGDGRFRLASLTGSASKDDAELIGAAARERARRRRLRELAAEIAALDAALAEVEGELAALARRRLRLTDELAARPDHRDVDDARDVLTRTEAAVAEADRTVRRGVERRAEAEAQVGAALRALTSRAAEHGVPADRTALDTLDRAVTTFGKVADLWLAALADARHARDSAERAEAAARRSTEAAHERAEAAAISAATVRRLAGRVSTVEDTVGAEYRDVLAQIGATREQEEAVRRESRTVRSTLLTLEGRIGELAATRANDGARRDEAVAARDAAADRFRARWRLGLPADAGWTDALAGAGTKATLEISRAVAAAWSDVPHEPRHVADALGRLAEAVHTSREALAGRADLALETEDDVQVLRAVVDGRTLGAAALVEAVTAEAERSRHDLTAAERELFDTTLTGETRRHLAARIREADALVEAMNERLARVRTASDVAVTLQWKVADDVAPGTRTARDLLLKDPVRLSEDDRDALHRFFRDRIDVARAEGTAGNWEQQLAEVFDYTRWHQFVVRLDRGDGRDFQPLTRKLHGALSGGEKAIALHLPLFAAIAAYYESVPGAPRLILLDEVFVGVDEVNRGQVFGLLTALGLDLVLTSDHEWCLYREIDAIAIHQLITGADDADDAVTTARWTWDGQALEEA